MLSALRNRIGDYLWLDALRKHRSRMGRIEAPRYTRYLDNAPKKGAPADSETEARAQHFKSSGWSSFSYPEAHVLAVSMLGKIKAEESRGRPFDETGRYSDDIYYKQFPEVEALFKGATGDFLRAAYGTDFKIFYGVCYKSKFDPVGPTGSQVWHSDGGPGTCINLMWCLTPVTAENGAMECLEWSDSFQIYQNERQATRDALVNLKDSMSKRNVRTDYYSARIAADYSSKIKQPNGAEGLIFAFSNNTLHKGGYPQPGHERYVCVFHIYPSAKATPFDRYRVTGIRKTIAIPKDPAFGDEE